MIESEFDFQTRLKNNVKILCKKQNLKIGEIESELHLSQGFFSRKYTKLSSYNLCYLAEKLKVDAYDLMKVDLKKIIAMSD